jgi:nucleoside 2-deoxyribosyltransferase
MTLKVYVAGHMPKQDEVDWRYFFTDYVNEYLRDKKIQIEFLMPEDSTVPETVKHVKHDVVATRDLYYLKTCDVAVVNLDLKMGQCLGAMWEFGYLRAHDKPVILINHHPELHKTKFLEHNASVVVRDMMEACEILNYMAGAK